MLLTFQDRLRIPWKGGAKQISFESIAPIIAIPLLIGLACINLHTFILCFGLCGGLVFYFLSQVRKHNIRSRFFFMWLFFSIIYIVVLFQLTVPLLELLPEENLILVLLTTATVFCMVRTKQLSYANHLYQSSAAVDDDELPDITEATEAEEREESQTALLLDMGDDCNNQPNICSICRKYMPAYTEHCNTCGVCIRRCDHHSFWFDCCIGQWNHRYYLASLILGLLSLLLGANLTLTAICHPFLVIRVLSIPVLLPDDCSEVFEDYQ